MSQFPNPATQFKPGVAQNPGGMTREQAAKRRANRDAAFALEERLLAALKKDMDERESEIIDHIRADVLRLIHTAIEREDGKPIARNELSNPDGTLAPQTVKIVAVGTDSSGRSPSPIETDAPPPKKK